MLLLHRWLARLCAPVLSWSDRQPRSQQDMESAQSRHLQRLVRLLAPTMVGKQFGLKKLPHDHRLRQAFAAQVPISTYGDYQSLITRVAVGEANILFPGHAVALAQTSGTTSSDHSGERYIPQNDALLRHHARGGAAAFSRLITATGGSIFSGPLLMLGGSTALTPNAHGLPVGDLSGIIADRIPRWLRPLYAPGLDIALEPDWEKKLTRIISRYGHEDMRLISGIPSWCLMLCERLCQARGVTRASAAWPHLQGFIHGGHAIAPLLPSLRAHFAPTMKMMEVYPASEAFIAIGSRVWQLDEAEPPPLDLLMDHGVYLEFLAEDHVTVVGPADIESGALYRVLITTPAGLVRYQLGDVVLGVAPGQIRVAGRIKTRLSIFGEHVEGYHLDHALSAAVQISECAVRYYHVAPYFSDAHDGRGGHEWLIACDRAPADLSTFAKTIDQYLCDHVIDYAAHRRGGQLLAPRITLITTDQVQRYLATHGKLGGQHKLPQAWPDRHIAEMLLSDHEKQR